MPVVPAAEIAPIVEALRVAQTDWLATGRDHSSAVPQPFCRGGDGGG